MKTETKDGLRNPVRYVVRPKRCAHGEKFLSKRDTQTDEPPA